MIHCFEILRSRCIYANCITLHTAMAHSALLPRSASLCRRRVISAEHTLSHLCLSADNFALISSVTFESLGKCDIIENDLEVGGKCHVYYKSQRSLASHGIFLSVIGINMVTMRRFAKSQKLSKIILRNIETLKRHDAQRHVG